MTNIRTLPDTAHADPIWVQLCEEAARACQKEPLLTGYISSSILGHSGFADALGQFLARELVGREFDTLSLHELFAESYKSDPGLIISAEKDLVAVVLRDPAAAGQLLTPFLFYKGFHALQSYRVAHWLWQNGRTTLACYLQSRMARNFSIDIHPAARIGHGIMMDHAHGMVKPVSLKTMYLVCIM